MRPWKLAVAILVFLACACEPARSYAAEPSGPVTLSTPDVCSAIAAGVAAPAPLLLPASLASDSSPVQTCGACSEPICVGKRLNSFCRGIVRLCQQVTFCGSGAAAPKCECLSPP